MDNVLDFVYVMVGNSFIFLSGVIGPIPSWCETVEYLLHTNTLILLQVPSAAAVIGVNGCMG